MGKEETWDCYACLKPLRSKDLTQVNFTCDSSLARIKTVGRVLLCKHCQGNSTLINTAVVRYVQYMGGTLRGNIEIISREPYRGD